MQAKLRQYLVIATVLRGLASLLLLIGLVSVTAFLQAEEGGGAQGGGRRSLFQLIPGILVR